MHTHLSPRDLAGAIGVSESSLKRWVDEGRLGATRTVGGHRRIALHEAIRFVRETGSRIARPELLGVSELSERASRMVAAGDGDAGLLAGLLAGDVELVRGLIFAEYLASRSIASVCDGPIASALHRIQEGGRGAVDAAESSCAEAVRSLRRFVPPTAAGARCVVIAAASTGVSGLVAGMASACLNEIGVSDVLTAAPVGEGWVRSVLADAASHRAAAVVLTMVEREGAAALARGLADSRVRLVIPASLLAGAQPPTLPNTSVVWSMAELVSLVRASLSSPAAVLAEPPARSNGKLPHWPTRNAQPAQSGR